MHAQATGLRSEFPNGVTDVSRNEIRWQGNLSPDEYARTYKIEMRYPRFDRPQVWVRALLTSMRWRMADLSHMCTTSANSAYASMSPDAAFGERTALCAAPFSRGRVIGSGFLKCGW
jgi:hypothetical protein